jgi:hypothetical protein
MNTLTESYLTRAELWLFITALVYFLMNGAQIFETAVFVPKWTAAPPQTMQLLNDSNGASLKSFWIWCHSIHEITFILAIVFCWKIEPVRNGLLLLFAVHFAVRVWTILYFAPNIMEFQRIADSPSATADLLQRTLLWKKLNYIRVGIFVVISCALIPLCMKLISIRASV